MKLHRTLVLLAACGGLAATAQAQKLSPGLWEMTMDMKGQGGEAAAGMEKMQAQLAKMSPEQRQQMEAMMASRGMSINAASGGTAMTVKSCISKESAERGDPPDGDGQRNCKRESITRSGNTMKFKVVCTNPPSSGEGEYTMTSDKSFAGKMLMTTERNGKAEQMEMKQSGKWVSADCGNLKPGMAGGTGASAMPGMPGMPGQR